MSSAFKPSNSGGVRSRSLSQWSQECLQRKEKPFEFCLSVIRYFGLGFVISLISIDPNKKKIQKMDQPLKKSLDLIQKAFRQMTKALQEEKYPASFEYEDVQRALQTFPQGVTPEERYNRLYEAYKQNCPFPVDILFSPKDLEVVKELNLSRDESLDELNRMLGSLQDPSSDPSVGAVSLYYKGGSFRLGRETILISDVVQEWETFVEEKQSERSEFRKVLEKLPAHSGIRPPPSSLKILYQENDVKGFSFKEFLSYLSVHALEKNLPFELPSEIKASLKDSFVSSEALRSDLVSFSTLQNKKMVTEEGKRLSQGFHLYAQYAERGLGQGLLNILFQADTESLREIPSLSDEALILKWTKFSCLSSELRKHFSLDSCLYAMFCDVVSEPLFDDSFVRIFLDAVGCLGRVDRSFSFVRRSFQAYFRYVRACFQGEHSEPLLLLLLTRGEEELQELQETKAHYFLEAIETLTKLLAHGGQKPHFAQPFGYELVYFLANHPLGNEFQIFFEKQPFKITPSQAYFFCKTNENLISGQLDAFSVLYQEVFKHEEFKGRSHRESLFLHPPQEIPNIVHLCNAISFRSSRLSYFSRSIQGQKGFADKEVWFMLRIALFSDEKISETLLELRSFLNVKILDQEILLLEKSRELLSFLVSRDLQRIKKTFQRMDTFSFSSPLRFCLFLRGAQFLEEGRGYLLHFLEESFHQLEKLGPLLDERLIQSKTLLLLLFCRYLSPELIQDLLSIDDFLSMREKDILSLFRQRADFCGDELTPEKWIQWDSWDPQGKSPPVLEINITQIKEAWIGSVKKFVVSLPFKSVETQEMRKAALENCILMTLFPSSQQLNEVMRIRRIDEIGEVHMTETVFATHVGLLKSVYGESNTCFYCHWIRLEDHLCLLFAFVSPQGGVFSHLISMKEPSEEIREEKLFESLRQMVPVFLSEESDESSIHDVLVQPPPYFTKTDLFLFLRVAFRSALSFARGGRQRFEYSVVKKAAVEPVSRSEFFVQISEEECEHIRTTLLRENPKNLPFKWAQLQILPLQEYIEKEARQTLEAAGERQARKTLEHFRENEKISSTPEILRTARERFISENSDEMNQSIQRNLKHVEPDRLILWMCSGSLRIPLQYPKSTLESPKAFRKNLELQWTLFLGAEGAKKPFSQLKNKERSASY